MTLYYELSSCATQSLLHKLGSRWVNEQASEIQNTLLYHNLVKILIYFGELHAQPNDPSINRSDSHPLLSVHLIQKWISVTWLNLKCVVLSCWGDHFCAFLCIKVHFDAFGCTCSDSYPLSGVHSFQKLITLVTHDKFKTLCSVMVKWLFWWILLHFARLYAHPDDSSMTCSDCYPLSSADLFQK